MDESGTQPHERHPTLVEIDGRSWIWRGGAGGGGHEQTVYEVVPKAKWKGRTFGKQQRQRLRDLGLDMRPDHGAEAGHEIRVRGQPWVHTGVSMTLPGRLIADDLYEEGVVQLKDGRRMLIVLARIKVKRWAPGWRGDQDPGHILGIDLADRRVKRLVAALAAHKQMYSQPKGIERLPRPPLVRIAVDDIVRRAHRVNDKEIAALVGDKRLVNLSVRGALVSLAKQDIPKSGAAEDREEEDEDAGEE
jgi:hypothetical protein